MGLTTERTDDCLAIMRADGQQECYLVLSEEERAKGFVRPVRHAYTHLKCGTSTRMATAIAETYARNPRFYGGTYCASCRTHFPLFIGGPYEGEEPTIENGGRVAQFAWDDDGTPVGS